MNVFLAEHGTRAALVRTLEEMRAWSAAKVAEDARIVQEYLDGAGGFPDRIAQVSIVGRFLSDFAFMTHQWAESALATVEEWPEDISQAEPDRQALTAIAARGEQVTTTPVSTDS